MESFQHWVYKNFELGYNSIVFVSIVVLGFLLRIWGINFGLPYAYHFDEPTYVSAALNLGAGIIGRQLNPTGFSNILFSEYAIYFILGWLGGLFTSLADFERFYRADPSVFLLLGRLTSAILGTLNIVVIYNLGKCMSGRLTGLIAALFLATTFIVVRDSHYAVPDIATTFFVSLSVLFCVMSVVKQSRRYIYLAAAIGGFAVVMKWSVGLVVLPIFLGTLFRLGISRRILRERSSLQTILASVIAFGSGFLLGGFQLVLKPVIYINDALRELRAGDAGGYSVWQTDIVSGWLFYLQTLSYGLGFALLALAILGAVTLMIRAVLAGDKARVLFFSFPLLYYAMMGSTQHYFIRYALPLVPFAALCAAEMVTLAAKWGETKRARLGWSLGFLLVVLAVVQPLANSIQHDLLLTRQDTRTLAKQWIESNIPAGSKIAEDWPTYGPPLSTAERRVPYSAKTYQVTIVYGTGLANYPLEWYREQGFDYLIASSFIYDILLVDDEQNEQRQAFYDSLDRELVLIQQFKPYQNDKPLPFMFDEIYGPVLGLWQRERPGPTLRIYQLTK